MNIHPILEELNKQEDQLIFKKFSNEMALDIGILLAKRVHDSQKPVAIRIYHHDVIVFQYSMDGKEDYHYDWIRKKRNLVMETGHSSMYARLEWQYLGKHQALAKDAMSFGFGCGAIPIQDEDHKRIGVIGMSGLPDPADHQIIMEVVCKYLGIEEIHVDLHEIEWNVKKNL